MEKDNKILGKKKNDLLYVANPKCKCSWLIHTIKTIIATSDKVISPHKYKFENTREAAEFNTSILKKCRYDFTRTIAKEKGIMLEPESEFRSAINLQPLFEDLEH